MNANYAKKGRFFDDSNGVREAAEAVSHADLVRSSQKYVAGTEEIPWNDFFRSVGLRVESVTNHRRRRGFHRIAQFRRTHVRRRRHARQRSRARGPAGGRHHS